MSLNTGSMLCAPPVRNFVESFYLWYFEVLSYSACPLYLPFVLLPDYIFDFSISNSHCCYYNPFPLETSFLALFSLLPTLKAHGPSLVRYRRYRHHVPASYFHQRPIAQLQLMASRGKRELRNKEEESNAVSLNVAAKAAPSVVELVLAAAGAVEAVAPAAFACALGRHKIAKREI